ncbi:MAG: TonB-dependent siderophore receptor [Cyanobacteria bacterium J06649_4]
MISKILSYGLFAIGWLTVGTPGLASTAKIQTDRQETFVASAALTVNEWVAQIESTEIAAITDIQVSEAAEGITITLISNQPLSAGALRVSGNALIAEIPNATLSLADEAAAEQFEPAEGIALVQTSALADGGVQIAITGTDAPPDVQVGSATGNLVLSVVPGVAQLGSTDDTIQLTVTGDLDEGYNPGNASITRLDTPILDTPASVQVIPRDVFEAQGADEFADALRSAAGVVSSNGPNDNFNNVTIRGFDIDLNYLQNGISEGANILQPPRDLNNVERLEILSGPASIVGGQISPGGIINVVTKQPLSTPFYELSASYGSFNSYEGAFDISGPLNEQNTVGYRLNASLYNSDTFIDVDDVDINRFSVAPVLSWQISEDTKISFEGLYLDSETPQRTTLPAAGTVLENPNGEVPRNQFIGEPSFDGNNREYLRIGYDLEHRFNDDWAVRHAFNYSNYQLDQREAFVNGLEDDFRTIDRSGDLFQDNINTYQTTAYITGEFETGPVGHRLLAGIDYFFQEDFFDFEFFEIEPIDLFDPVFTGLGATIPDSQGSFRNTNDGVGIYLQDQLSFFEDRLRVVLGGRFDFVGSASADRLADTPEESQGDSAFSPTVGILYKPVENVSLYGSFSRSFEQVTGRSATNELFEPSRGTQYEVGAKADFLDGRLSTTLALFDLTQSNVLTVDLDEPAFDTQAGEQRSRGIELSTRGEILSGWDVIASYTYTDAEVSEDNSIPVGNQLSNVPENAASLWTQYTIPDGDLEGLGFGLGLFYVGEREGDLDNSFQLPSYFRTDAALTYQRDNFNIGLNVKNLFDVRYFESADDDLRVSPAEPFNLQLSLSYSF